MACHNIRRWFKHRYTMPLSLLLLFTAEASGQVAPPLLPSSFYGTVTLDSKSVAPGVIVVAEVDGVPVAETTTFVYIGRTYYAINVPGDDPSTSVREGGSAGESITFMVGIIAASPSAVWRSGANRRVDLVVQRAEQKATH